jgi:hypothetical protein
MTDDMTAGKAELEERDRIKANADLARSILDHIDGDWRDWHVEAMLDELLDALSWGEALQALEYIDWEDEQAVKETAFERRQRDPDR